MKIIIYQVITRLWGPGRFSSWNKSSLSYLRTLGVDYVWYTGVPRHASGKDFVKGNPGSPYSISDWMDVNPYLADKPERRMEEFEALVSRTHEAGLKVMLDFIPNHTAPDYVGGICSYDWHDGDWTDTRKNDWTDGRTEKELLNVLRFWASKGVDGFRCDMVELVPQEALARMIAAVKEEYPSLIFVAEAYNMDNYRTYVEKVGFDLLYDKSGLYDTLRAIDCRNLSTKNITSNWLRLSDLQPRMLNFLENHDEQRIASPWYDGSPQKAYAALTVAMLFNTASFMLYFGQEVGENAAEGHEGRTSIFEWSKPEAIGQLYNHAHSRRKLPSPYVEVLAKYRSLLKLSRETVFAAGKTWDLCYCNMLSPGFDPDRHFVFARYDDSKAYVVACNFSNYPARISVNIPVELHPYFPQHTINLSVPAWDSAIVKA